MHQPCFPAESQVLKSLVREMASTVPGCFHATASKKPQPHWPYPLLECRKGSLFALLCRVSSGLVGIWWIGRVWCSCLFSHQTPLSFTAIRPQTFWCFRVPSLEFKEFPNSNPPKAGELVVLPPINCEACVSRLLAIISFFNCK